MGFRLKITFKSERKFVVLTNRPLDLWCDACGGESRFVDEEANGPTVKDLSARSSGEHRTIIDGRSYLCLRAFTDEP